jgi:hypothetical protein
VLRYPGPRSFEDSPLDRKLFFGRTVEKQELLDLALASDLVVLYARSGTGKTSLINVGLLQPLRAAHRRGTGETLEDAPGYYFPLVARVNDLKRGPLGSLCDCVGNAATRARLEHRIPAGDVPLLDFFRGLELWSGDQLLVPVLILDQFEELFTLHGAEARQAFIAQFGELVREQSRHSGAPLLKVVISMREDFLGHLEELSRELPRIFATRYRLGPLSSDAAREAIECPARLEEEGLTTRPFEFEPQAVERILAFLCRRRVGADTTSLGEAEPFQLQLICQRAEEIAARRQRADGPGRAVSLADLGGDEGLVEILGGYYEGVVREQADADAVYLLCEKGLVSVRGRRLSLEEGEVVDRFQVPVDTLRGLVDRRLLRADPRLESVYYELSHDTLIEAVLRSRRRRYAAIWQRRLTVSGVALSILVVVAFLAVRTPWFHGQRALAEGGRILDEARERAGHSGGDDVLRAQWSRVLACMGSGPDALELVESIEDDEAQAEALVRLSEMTGVGPRKELEERTRASVDKTRDPDRKFELALRIGAWDAALAAAAMAKDHATKERLQSRLIDATRVAGPRAGEILAGVCRSDEPRSLMLALEVAPACARGGHGEEAGRVWIQALAGAEALTDGGAAVSALGRLTTDLAAAGRGPEAKRALASAERRLAGVREASLRTELLAQLALAALQAGSAEGGRRLWAQAVHAAGQIEGSEPRYRAFVVLAIVSQERPVEPGFAELMKRALGEARQVEGAGRVGLLRDAARLLRLGKQEAAATPVFQETAAAARSLDGDERFVEMLGLAVAAAEDAGAWWQEVVAFAPAEPLARFYALSGASDQASPTDPRASEELWLEATKTAAELPPEARVEVQIQILSRLIRKGRLAEARAHYLELGSSPPDPASNQWAHALVHQAERSPDAGLLHEAEEAARRIQEPTTRSEALAHVASGFARAGAYKQARDLAASCPELGDRLRVQAEVLLAKAMRDWPSRQELIRGVRDKDWESGGGGF